MDRCNCICNLCVNLCEESRVAIVSRKNEIPSEIYVVLKMVQEKTSRYEEFSLMILKINNKRNLLLLLDIVQFSPLVCLWNLQLSYVLLSDTTRIVYGIASDIFWAELSNHDNILFIFNSKNNTLFGPSLLHSAVRNLFLLHGCKESFLLLYRFRKKKKKKKKKGKNGSKEKQISRQLLGQREAAFIQELIKRIVPEFS